jgi:glycosyltransferase involved in cell wall biosynthesis
MAQENGSPANLGPRMCDATIVITTRNRRDELRRALESAIAQAGDVEVLVIDDGSTDGTEAMVRSEFPSVRLHRSAESRGLIAQRNAAALLAAGKFIVSMDDDAVLTSQRTVTQTLADFDDPRVGAVAIPFVDHRGPMIAHRHLAPDPDAVWVTDTYTGTAHAVRRAAFLAVGGYRECLVHQAEEPDLCLRLLDAGYVTRLGRADPLHHHESSSRNLDRVITFSRRNDLLGGWHNVPLPYLPVRLAKVTLHSLWFALAWRRPRAVLRGVVRGYLELPAHASERRPVSRATYRLSHQLRKRGPLRLEEIAAQLPPIQPAAPSSAVAANAST